MAIFLLLIVANFYGSHASFDAGRLFLIIVIFIVKFVINVEFIFVFPQGPVKRREEVVEVFRLFALALEPTVDSRKRMLLFLL